MHDSGIRVPSSDFNEVFLLSERQVIDLETIVQCVVAFRLEPHFNISKPAMANVETSWHANGFNEATEPAPLPILDLLLDPIRDILSVGTFFLPRFNRELLAITV